MKKSYIIPETEAIVLSSNHQLLAGSLSLSGEYTGGTVLARELGGDDFIDFADDAITDLGDDAITNFDNF